MLELSWPSFQLTSRSWEGWRSPLLQAIQWSDRSTQRESRSAY
jgi:hypothetical protein